MSLRAMYDRAARIARKHQAHEGAAAVRRATARLEKMVAAVQAATPGQLEAALLAQKTVLGQLVLAQVVDYCLSAKRWDGMAHLVHQALIRLMGELTLSQWAETLGKLSLPAGSPARQGKVPAASQRLVVTAMLKDQQAKGPSLGQIAKDRKASDAARDAQQRHKDRLAKLAERKAIQAEYAAAEGVASAAAAVFAKGEGKLGLLDGERKTIEDSLVRLVASSSKSGAKKALVAKFGDFFSPSALANLATGIMVVSPTPWTFHDLAGENLWDIVADVLVANNNGVELLARVASGEIAIAVDVDGRIARPEMVKAHQRGVALMLAMAGSKGLSQDDKDRLREQARTFPSLIPTGIDAMDGIWNRKVPVETWFKADSEGSWYTPFDPKKLGARVGKLYMNSDCPEVGRQKFFILTGKGISFEECPVLNGMFSSGSSFPTTEQFAKIGSARCTSPVILLKTVGSLRPACFDTPELVDCWIAAFSSVKSGAGPLLSLLQGKDWWETMSVEQAEAAFAQFIRAVEIPHPVNHGQTVTVEGVFVEDVPVRVTSLYSAYKLKPVEEAIQEALGGSGDEDLDGDDDGDHGSSAHSAAVDVLRQDSNASPIQKCLDMLSLGLVQKTLRTSKWNHQDFHLIARSFGLNVANQILANEWQDRKNAKSIEAFNAIKEAQIVGQDGFVPVDPLVQGGDDQPEGIVGYGPALLAHISSKLFDGVRVSSNHLTLEQANAVFGGFWYQDGADLKWFKGLLNHQEGFVITMGGFHFYFPSVGLMAGEYRPADQAGEQVVILGKIASSLNVLVAASRNENVNWERAYYDHHAALSQAVMHKRTGTVNIPGLSLTILPAWWVTSKEAVYWSGLDDYRPAAKHIDRDGDGGADAVYTKQPALFNNAVCKVRVFGKDAFPSDLQRLLKDEAVAFGSRNILYVSPDLLLTQHNDCDGDAARLAFPSEASLSLLPYWSGQDPLFSDWEQKYVLGEQDLGWKIKSHSRFEDGLLTASRFDQLLEIHAEHEAEGRDGFVVNAIGVKEFHCAVCEMQAKALEATSSEYDEPKDRISLEEAAVVMLHAPEGDRRSVDNFLMGVASDLESAAKSLTLEAATEASRCQALVGIESNVLYRVSMACEYVEFAREAIGKPLTEEQRKSLYVLQEVVSMVLQDEAMSGAKHALSGQSFADVYSIYSLCSVIAGQQDGWEDQMDLIAESFQVYVTDGTQYFDEALFFDVFRVIARGRDNLRTQVSAGNGIVYRPLTDGTCHFAYNGAADVFLPSVVKGIAQRLNYADSHRSVEKEGGLSYAGGVPCFTRWEKGEDDKWNVINVPFAVDQAPIAKKGDRKVYPKLAKFWGNTLHCEEFVELAHRGLALLPGSKLGAAVLGSKQSFVNASICAYLSNGQRFQDILVQDIEEQGRITGELESQVVEYRDLIAEVGPVAGVFEDSVNELVRKFKKACGRVNKLQKVIAAKTTSIEKVLEVIASREEYREVLKAEAAQKEGLASLLKLLKLDAVNGKVAKNEETLTRLWEQMGKAETELVKAEKAKAVFKARLQLQNAERKLFGLEKALGRAQARLEHLEAIDPYIKDDLGHALAGGVATPLDLALNDMVRQELKEVMESETAFAVAAAQTSVVPDLPSEDDLPYYEQYELVDSEEESPDWETWEQSDVAEDDEALQTFLSSLGDD